MSNIYDEAETWAVFKGCRFNCSYCIPSFQRQSKRWGKGNCQKCYDYEPHFHEERLDRIPSSRIVFVGGSSDLFFCPTEHLEKIVERIKEHQPRKEKTFYFQSKVPQTFERIEEELPDNCVILTTCETNKHVFSDGSSYGDYSQARTPSERLKDFIELSYERKVLTVEPIMEFTETFGYQISRIPNLEGVWIGYNTLPDDVDLPEPSQRQVSRLIKILEDHDIEVKKKDLRGVEDYEG